MVFSLSRQLRTLTIRIYQHSHGKLVLVGLVGELASDELPPSLVRLVDDLDGVLLRLGLAREGKDVLRLAVGDLVDPEPLVGGSDQAGEVPLDILDVVQSGSERVVDVNDEDLPVGLALVKESHDTEDLDLLDLADGADGLTDLANVERVVVAVGAGLGVRGVGVLPSLREGSVVPNVTVVREAVADVSQLALLDVWCERKLGYGSSRKRRRLPAS